MVKAKEKAKEEEEAFFVGIGEPMEIRRPLLEASKDLLQYMQRFEQFKENRNAKAEALNSLRDVTAELSRLVSKLKTELPKTKLRAKPMREETRKAEPKNVAVLPKGKVKKAEPKKEGVGLEKLESELEAIEERLTKLK